MDECTGVFEREISTPEQVWGRFETDTSRRGLRVCRGGLLGESEGRGYLAGVYFPQRLVSWYSRVRTTVDEIGCTWVN